MGAVSTILLNGFTFLDFLEDFGKKLKKHVRSFLLRANISAQPLFLNSMLSHFTAF